MNFASPFVFVAEEPEVAQEEVHEDEMVTGWAASAKVEIESSDDEDDGVTAQGEPRAKRAATEKKSFISSMSSWAGFGRKPATGAAAPLPAVPGAAPAAAAAPGAPAPPPPPQQQQQQQQPAKAKKLRFERQARAADTPSYRRQVDVNVVSVQLSTLAQAVDVHSGDVTVCGCGAVLNALSTVAPAADGQKLWTCEFCGTQNLLDLHDEEMPKSESVDYILKPAPAVEQHLQEASRRIIFCLDTSGSMCVTTAVPGNFKLKNDRRGEMARTLNTEGSQQWMAGERRDVTYVSRLQCMQGAIESQLVAAERVTPDRGVGLVTFSSDVQLLGDCSRETVVVAGDKLTSLEALRAAVAEAGAGAIRPLRESRTALTSKLMQLEEGGQTALGPAIVCAIEMACAGGNGAGSTVVVCTDGLANIGIGSLDGVQGAAAEAAASFYTQLATYAKERGVTVNVITITGQECRLEELSALADISGGDVELVNPLELRDNFQAMLENPTLALNVQVTMLLHHDLRFRNDDPAGAPAAPAPAAAAAAPAAPAAPAAAAAAADAAPPPPRPTACKRVVDVGNATAESEQFFEFSVANRNLPPGTKLPFQLQVRFKRLNGMECLRVLTMFQAVTKDRQEAERDVNVAVLSANAAQQSAHLAAKGAYRDARLNAFAWRNMMGRAASSTMAQPQQQVQFANYMSAMSEFDSAIQQQQQQELTTVGDLEELSGEVREQARRRARTDADARVLHKTKHVSSKAFK